ncbi:MAG: carbohydrate-binding family 9-like protein [Polyangiales bacterium]
MRPPLLALCVLAAIGCTEKISHDPQEAELLPKILLKAAPTPAHPSELQFGSKLRLLGYDVSTDAPAVGKPFKVTWYWQVLEPLDNGWKIFTHLSDGKINRVNLDSDRVVRRVYPEARWKKGEYLRDEQEITLPSDWSSREAVFYLGFYSGETRLPVSHGKDDGARRAEALRLKLVAASNAQPAPEPSVARLIARRTTGPVTIDGKLDEADWHAAQSTGPFVNTLSGETGAFDARVQVLYDAEAIYCGFVVSDDYLKSTHQKSDDHLWEQDTVEVMFDPDGDARNYFELQVSPRGVSFDTRYDAPRNPRPFGHVDWSSQVSAKVQLDGTLDDDRPDTGYKVELRVPWTAFATGEPPAQRPGAGATWRINFFVMDARQQGQRAVGWSPPKIGDFHTLDKFGRVVFPEDPAPTQGALLTR